MPTVHYISRETLRKHGIGHIPWELLNDKKRRLTTTNDAFATNAKTEVLDGTIRNNNATPGTAATKREEQQPPYKSTGMDNINDDVDDKLSPSSSSSTSKLNDVQPVQSYDGKGIRSIQQIEDNVQENECHKHSEPKVDESKQKKNFFSRVDELKVYKQKHGHLNVRQKENQSLYGFCFNVRLSRIGKGKCTLDDNRISALDAIGFKWEMVDTRAVFFARVDELRAYKEEHGHLKVHQKEDKSLYMFCNHVRQARRVPKSTRTKLTEDRVAALDAIGFDWKLEAGASYSVASKDDKFFAQVDKLRAYKEKHGHLNVRTKDDKSLYEFCRNLRSAWKGLRQAQKGKIHYSLDGDRIAALDAIGFDWKLRDGVSSTAASKDDKLFDRVDELKAYKEKHGHLNVRPKDDQSLYNFCRHVRQARRAIISGKRTSIKLTEDRIAALDAIGFDWKLRYGGSYTVTSKDDKFFAQVDKLKAYKEKHGHLNVRPKDDQSLYDFCHHVRQARKGKGSRRLDETRIAALDAIGFNWDPLELKMSSTSPCAMSKSTQQATNPKINIGDVGYQFLKEFDSGWYNGTVIEILQDADDGWDRRCIYEDGDCEDLTLNELIRLATLSSREHVGTIKVVGGVESIDGGSVKVAASLGVSIVAAKENPVIQKASRLKHQPLSKTMTSSTDDLFLAKNSKSPSNKNKAMAMDLASLSSVDYDDLTLRELKRLPALAPHVVAIEKVLRSMRTIEDDGVKRLQPSEGMPILAAKDKPVDDLLDVFDSLSDVR